MYENNSFLGGPDFSSLAPPPPEQPGKTPEFLKDDDDDDTEDEPKTIRDYFEKKDDDAQQEAETEEDEQSEPESETEAETEIDNEEIDGEEDDNDDVEVSPNSKEMTDDEEPAAAVEIIDDRKKVAQTEADEAQDVETESEALAAQAFLDAAQNEIDQGQPVDEALEAAKSKTLQELDLETVQSTEPETEPGETEPPESETETLPEQPVAVEIPEPVNEPEEPEAVVPPVAPTSSPMPSSATTTSPQTPASPAPNLPPMPPGRGLGVPVGGPGALGGNVMPASPTNLNVSPSKPEASFDRRAKGRHLLVGGIVGYMIGRRGGRIRTEAKLLPIQHKLEKEVGELHDKIFWYEAGVRNLAHERAVQNPNQAKQTAERLKQQKRETSVETEIEKPEAEAVVEHKTDSVQSEQLGKMAVETEPTRTENKLTPEQLKSIDLMTVPELLVIAQRIELEQSNVRLLYESNRLDYESLRRIVRAFLRGERYDQLVRDNLLTPEKYAYPETLSANGVIGGQTNQTTGYQTGQAVQPPQSIGTQPQNPSTSFVVQPAQNAPPAWDENTHPQKQNLKGVIIAGIVIAVLLVIFVIAR